MVRSVDYDLDETDYDEAFDVSETRFWSRVKLVTTRPVGAAFGRNPGRWRSTIQNIYRCASSQ